MKAIYLKQLIAFTIAMQACGLGSPEIPGLEAGKWKNDPFGCDGDRNAQLATLSKHKDLLLGYSQNEIKYYLGKPDEQELYDRSQTFFHYYIAGHTSCPVDSMAGAPVILQIRFNALNSSNEVYIRNFIEESL